MRNGHSPQRQSLAVAAGAAAVGLVAGLAAAAGRKAAAHAAEAMTGDWFDVLRAEHLMVAEIFDLIDATGSSDTGKRRRLFGRLKAALDKHAFQEETVVYPALGLARSDAEAKELVLEHAEMKSLLYQIERMPADDADWIRLVQRLRATIEAHVREEEDEIFPVLRERLDPAQEADLTAALHKAGFKLA